MAKPRMATFFTANEITVATIKQALFLNSLDESGYTLLHNLCVPNLPEEKTYDDLIKLFDEHFLPSESTFSLLNRFYNATRETNETLPGWLARLRSLGGPCQFEQLDAMLLDRFVLGLKKGPVKDRLFEEDRKKLTMEKAMTIATAKESASHQYDLTSMSTAVDAVKQEPVLRTSWHRRGRERTTTGTSKGQQAACGICGRRQPPPCWHKDVACNSCKGNHLVKVVRAASPVLLRVITLGAFFIYCTTIVMYPRPNIVTCTTRVWLREIGFSLTYGALMLKTWRISVIFRVRSAKAVKITDLDLLKRLGMIVAVFSMLLVIRTLVAPPRVIIGKTADDLKAYLCQTDWWDHSFTILEVMFLIWGIRLCIVVRKAPSEFNESRFISMAIYNEFLLSLFLNISMLFLQSPANPDLLYIIFFCHTQMTVTLLLCFIFGSKAYLVFKGLGKSEDTFSTTPKVHITKFLNKPRSGNSQYAVSTNSSTVGADLKLTEQDIQDEFKRLYMQLEQLKEKNMRHGNRHLAARINAMQEAGRLQTADENEETSFVKSEGSSSPNQTSFYPVKHDCADDQSAPTGNVSPEQHQTAGDIGASRKNGKPPEAIVNNNCCTVESSEASIGQFTSTAHNAPVKGNNSSAPNRPASKMPIHLNLDDTSRFTEEVTV